MKRNHLTPFIIVLIAAALFAHPEPAYSQAGRPYLWLDLGPAKTSTTELTEFTSVPISGSKVKFDTGVRFGVGGGFHFTDWLAGELETGFIYNSIRSVEGATERNSSVSQAPMLVNLVLQAPNNSRLIPFIGGGLGGAVSVFDTDSFTIGATEAVGSFSDLVFAYQGFAGLRYRINDHMEVGLFYKYFVSEGPSWEPDLTIGTSGNIAMDTFRTHSINFAFRFSF